MLLLNHGRAGILGGMEEALLSNPDDTCLHQAYASALMAQGDPASTARARYIQAQMRLEERRVGDEERRALQGREKKLLRDHGKTWLGGLSAWLLRGDYSFSMRRGWLDSITAPELDPEFLGALVRSPIARLLRSLVIESAEPGGASALAALLHSSLAETLEEFRLGEEAGEPPSAILRRLVQGQ